ncbi:lipase [Kibdelosporangium persicum]|uniref:Platelet-activating factor acetylhydrolase isoform II n=1 Tax=Kibdelosporangium persicum TaxID=2698649 RepID=A0ABX2FDV7_9PSEU|nr:lipase [Kibdelosporangium persicum]NRN69314.1 Platelet-activating factor acetylhydrolase isoform II [Kibdelosporangium persicum]
MSFLTKTLAAGVVSAAVLVGAPVSASAKVAFSLPAPTGHHQVGTTEIHLVDGDRQDPWKPDRKRELMISVWYPAKDTRHHPRAQWLPDGLFASVDAFAAEAGIPKGSVDWTGPKTSGHVDAPAKPGKRPVVLYSPGFGGPRAVGTALVQELASRGYVVVTIDHTFETTVEFPGGRVEHPVEIPAEQMAKALRARGDDTRFVLDELADRGWHLDDVGMFGHSYGGFTAGETMLHDRRIDAGINMDGGMFAEFGDVAERGLDRPFMLLGGQLLDENGVLVDHSPFTDIDPSWPQFWANQTGPKRSVVLTGARHHNFSDLQVILPQLVKPLNLPEDHFVELIGTIDPAKAYKAQYTDIRRFFDRYLS